MEPGVNLRIMHGKKRRRKKVTSASDASLLLKTKDFFNTSSYFMFINRSI